MKKLNFILIIISIIFCYLDTHGQGTRKSFNLDIGAFSMNDGEKGRIHAALSHEWKPKPFLGIELQAGVGRGKHYSDWYEFNSETVSNQRNIKEINLNFQTLSSKLNNYLIMKYDEQDQPLGYLYAGVGLGLATIQSKGHLIAHTGDEIKAETSYPPHLFSAIEIGYGARIAESMFMDICFKIDNIPFENATAEMDKDVHFTPKFRSDINSLTLQVSFKYLYNHKNQ